MKLCKCTKGLNKTYIKMKMANRKAIELEVSVNGTKEKKAQIISF